MVHTVPYVQEVAAGKRKSQVEKGDLSPEDWALAALLAWGEGGFRAVAVEPLAERLGVTKGSFYWHFKSRADLVKAAVSLWETQGTDAVIAELEKLPSPREKLVALFRRAWDQIDRLRAEGAIGATALTGEPLVAETYQRVQRKRLEYVAQLYRELGLKRGEAMKRAITTYSAFLGSLQILLIGEESLASERGLKRQVKAFESILIPD